MATLYSYNAKEQSENENVRKLQFWLHIIARSNRKVPSITVDGLFGANTKTAVESFQSAYGLTANGEVDLTTWNKIFEVYTALQNELISGSQLPGTYPNKVLQKGSFGARVTEVQYYLYLLSAYYPQISVISYDGFFGPITEKAVKEYQNLFSLTTDGKVGPATWPSIYNRFVSFNNFNLLED